MTTTISPERSRPASGSPRAPRPTLDAPPEQTARQTGFRTDIQALRALAVTLVLVYHLWPNGLTGGFVGVDVFFVVSGFLITAHLLNRPPSTARDFAGFWARRIRRLLPASLLVLGVTLLASRLLAPETHWANTAKQAAAAVGYVQNWVLAADAVDYLAAENAATPVQHFWSLSVEEQFYLLWPLLLALLGYLAIRRSRTWVTVIGLIVVVATSLTVSVWFTLVSPASAYFVTPTRAWEFGLGGLLAALLARRRSLRVRSSVRLTNLGRTVLAGIGFSAIGYAAVVFDAGTSFPGGWALVPTLGTVAVLAAVPTAEVGPFGRILAVRPVEWLGDVSYSVYLWHWPLIVLLPYVVGGPLGLLDKLAVIALTLLLAELTKRFVEDRFRNPSARRGLLRVYLAAAAAMALVLGLAAVQTAEVGRRNAAAAVRLEVALSAGNPCFGAGTLNRGHECEDMVFDGVLPAPALAPKDRSELYADVSGKPSCWADAPRFAVRTCHFGDPAAKRQLALVGNSHAGQWLPALQAVAEREGWGITTFVASRCALAPVQQRLLTPALQQYCTEWVDKVSARIEKGGFDLVILSNRMARTVVGTGSAEESASAYQRGYERLLTRWAKAKVTTLALHDTPAPTDGGIPDIPDCVAENRRELSRCSGSRQDWVPQEPLAAAVEEVDAKRITFAELTDDICDPDRCHPVVGGVMVYYDGQHLSATYATTLGGALADAIGEATRKS